MKKILTGLQPSGKLTIGNYIGSILQMVKLQEEGLNLYLFIADMHALTVKQDPKELHENIKCLIATYLACGIDYKKNTIYLQSDNEYIANISWFLECNTSFGELSRMTQFKDKSSKNNNFYAGLFTYPVLMAADILAFDTDLVPVGQDQKQHLEIARNIAQHFNKTYGDTFKIPEPYIATTGSKIMDLVDPTKKMSKSSENPKSIILLTDDEKSIRKKINSATTDSECIVKYDLENKPGISNLMTIASVLDNKTCETIEKEFENKTYGDFKKYVGDVIVNTLIPIQKRYEEIINSDLIEKILIDGSNKTKPIAYKKYKEMKEKLGLFL